MSIEALRVMPLSFRSLVVELTSVCNASCAMCYQAAGPKGSDILGRKQLSVADVKPVISDVSTSDHVQKRFHLAGGEAFLNMQSSLQLLEFARLNGFSEISATTNAIWGTKESKARHAVRRLKDAGLTTMEISWDAWHAPYIKPDAISNCIIANYENGIQTHLRLLTSKTHSICEALEPFSASVLACVDKISSNPVMPTGRAKATIAPDEIWYTDAMSGSCHSVLNLTVNARGDVSPCCAGADQTEALSFGNIRRNSIAQILERMHNSYFLRALVFLGPGALCGILAEAGIPISNRYASICHLCWDIFHREESAKAIKSYFENLEHSNASRVLRVARSFSATSFQ
jgi:hypothetical protein